MSIPNAQPPRAQAFEATLFGLVASTMREGTRALLEKRPAALQGK